jgi:DNA-binding NtrC family response regulator
MDAMETRCRVPGAEGTAPPMIPIARDTLPKLKVLMEDYERRLILSALAVSRGHQRRAAASLGVLPTTLLEKMKRLGIHAKRVHRVPPLVPYPGASAGQQPLA